MLQHLPTLRLLFRIRFLIPFSVALLLLTRITVYAQASVDTRELSADIVRVLSKDLFDINSIPFMQPMVETFNATSNAGFYSAASIPTTDTFYLRIGLRGTFGIVRDDQKTFTPNIPTRPTENKVASQLALLIANRVKEIFKRGVEEDSIQVPTQSATILGDVSANFLLNNNYLLREIRKDSVYTQAIALGLDSTLIDDIIIGLPGALTLPSGADLSTIIAVVPQIEVGALYGTELVLRYIPPIKLDTNVGRFTFWGAGLRHSLSQYFSSTFDLALFLAWQNTSLENSVGVTNAQLEVNASTFNGAIQASKQLGTFFLYSGIGLENTRIDMTYRYTLPRQLQAQLELITPIDLNSDGIITDDEFVPDPENGFPGDTKPQTSTLDISDTSINFTIGIDFKAGPFHLLADIKLGTFNVFSSGISVDL